MMVEGALSVQGGGWPATDTGNDFPGRARAFMAAAPRRHLAAGPRFLALSPSLAAVVAVVTAAGIGTGMVAIALGGYENLIGLVAVVVAVGVGQALALELE